MGARVGGWDARVDDLIAEASRADIHATAQRSRARAAGAAFAGATAAALAAAGIWAWGASGSFGSMLLGAVDGVVIALWAVTGGVAAREIAERRRAERVRDAAMEALKSFRNGRSHDGGQVR